MTLARRWALRQQGFTLIEMMVSVAILGIILVVIANNNRRFATEMTKDKIDAELQVASQRIMARFKVDIVKAGVGVVNGPSSPNAKSLFVSMDAVDSPEIIFFWRDAGPSLGQIDSTDTWKRIRLNNGAIEETIFKGVATWAPFKITGMPGTTIVSNTFYQIEPGISIVVLEFNYYTSAQTLTTDGYAASYVRVNLHLKKGDVILKKSEWILLKNVLYARTN